MYKYMFTDIIDFCNKYLPSSVFVAVLLCIYSYVARQYRDIKVRRVDPQKVGYAKWVHILVMFIFFVYLFMLLCITFLSREPGSRDAVRLQLFCIFSEDVWARTYALENMVLFIPLGILLPLNYSKFDSFKWTVLAGMTSSIIIELIQRVTKMGYSELDDILNNTIGTMIGYGVLVVVKRMIRSLHKAMCIRNK